MSLEATIAYQQMRRLHWKYLIPSSIPKGDADHPSCMRCPFLGKTEDKSRTPPKWFSAVSVSKHHSMSVASKANMFGLFRCAANDRDVTSNSFHSCVARKRWESGGCAVGGRSTEEETGPGVKLGLPRPLVFLVKVLTAKNDALFMGPGGEERLWPKWK